MSFFKYTAQHPAGRTVKGVLEAASTEDVLEQIRAKDLYPVKVRKVSKRLRRRVPEREIMKMFKNLAGLLDSGISMDRAVALAARNVGNQQLKETLRDIVERVQKGEPLSGCLRAYGDIFGNAAYSMVRAGEAGGRLREVLHRLSEQMERQIRFKRRLVSAAIYPSILLGISVISIIVLLVFVIPKFGSIFEDLNQEIPVLTSFFLDLGTFLRNYFLAIPLGLAALILAAKLAVNRPGSREKLDALMLRIPYLREMVLDKEFSKFFRTTGMLLSGGVLLLKAIDMGMEVLSNSKVIQAVAPLRNQVKTGGSMSRFFLQNDMFPEEVGAMIFVSEEQGRLAPGLIKLGDDYEENFEVKLERLTQFMEPAVIIATGAIIGLVVLSMFTAIFGITDIQM